MAEAKSDAHKVALEHKTKWVSKDSWGGVDYELKAKNSGEFTCETKLDFLKVGVFLKVEVTIMVWVRNEVVLYLTSSNLVKTLQRSFEFPESDSDTVNGISNLIYFI